MTGSIPVLWPDHIEVDVAPPIAILRAQIEPLRGKSGGLVEAKLSTTNASGFVRHHLDLVAPALGYRTQRLLSVTHQEGMVYPAKVEAHYEPPRWETQPGPANWSRLHRDPAAVTEGLDRLLGSPGTLWIPNAATEAEFVMLVGGILRSPGVQGLIQSYIVLSKEGADPDASTSLPENASG